jgi:PIN domain nuclease of toxin-antitoxin system
MRVLLDTHAFLWWVIDDPKLTRVARRTIARSACVVSIASCWEMAIKVSRGSLDLPEPVDAFVQRHVAENGFALLDIALEHASAVAGLPFHHRDPFDRLLVAQAAAEQLPIVSADSVFSEYGVKRVW